MNKEERLAEHRAIRDRLALRSPRARCSRVADGLDMAAVAAARLAAFVEELCPFSLDGTESDAPIEVRRAWMNPINRLDAAADDLHGLAEGLRKAIRGSAT